ncbi:DUF4145 domain-containing protein [Rhizobium leguminosarum]|uniref:DUF4145 domain-containing protein n=1 Tax=Rhizobium leguminosarum TaxID=384 RepID=UPI003F9DBD2D
MAKSNRRKQPVIEKAHCPTCNREQNCILHGRADKPWRWEDRYGNSMVGGNAYSLFECCGCETVFTETSSWDENNIDQWYDYDGAIQSEAVYTKITLPGPPARPRPDWLDKIGKLDPNLFHILDETYRCYDEKCFILAAIGLRTALDSCVASVKIDPAKSFQEKLKELKEQGFIGDTEHGILTVLTNAGSAAAHRGWSPNEEQTTHLLDVLENFIHRVLVNGQKALEIKSGIPEAQKRKRAGTSKADGA